MRGFPSPVLLGLLALGCATGPSDEPLRLPTLGEYRVEMSGPRGSSTWSRSFTFELLVATHDSLVMVTTGGDLPAGIRRTAGLIDYIDRADWRWHTIFGVAGGNVVLSWWPDGTCQGRLLVDFEESYPGTDCWVGHL